MRKIMLAVVMMALLTPILAALCQWQCHFMPGSESPMTHQLLVPATQRMECCANQEVVLKKPLPVLTPKFAPATSLDPALQARLEVPERHRITHEGPPGATPLSAFISSSPILRI